MPVPLRFLAGLLWLLVAGSSGRGEAPKPLAMGRVPLLFVDDAGIVSQSGVVRAVHPARTRTRPVLEPDRPWEGDRVYTYGSVHFDAATGEFMLWYLSRTQRVDGIKPAPQLRAGGQDVVLLAFSTDGIAWRKPELGMHAYLGSKANNLVFDVHSPSVVVDRFEPDPARRFKLLGYFRGGYVVAHSPDGVHWSEFPGNPVFKGGDTVSMTQDPRTGEFLVYHKRPDPEQPGRVVWLSRSRDLLHWSGPVRVLRSDAEDQRWATTPDQRTDIYNMTVLPHAGGFVGLPTVFRVMSSLPKETKTALGQSGQDGPIDVQLATSVDGETWRRSWPRVAMIPRGAPGAFDAGVILGLTSNHLDVADETWIYYTAINTGHGAPIPPKRATLGLAVWRRHGFASLDAGPTGGTVETVPMEFSSPEVVLNADASRGEVRVAVLESDGSPVAGLTATECEPLRVNATRWSVHWTTAVLVPVDRPVRLRFEMNNARLYSVAGAADSR